MDARMVMAAPWRRWLLLVALLTLGVGYLVTYAFFLAHSVNFIVAGRNAAAEEFSSAHPIHLPAKLVFGSNKPDTRRLGGGWNLPGDGIWSGDHTAWLALVISPDAGDIEVRVNCGAFVSSSVPHNTVTIEVNHEPAGSWVKDEQSAFTSLQFRVPARLTKSGLLMISIHVEHVASPFQLGIGLDRRHLGLLLSSIELTSPDATPTGPTTQSSAKLQTQ